MDVVSSFTLIFLIKSLTCVATWPALWLSDVYNWPLHGEIDVMEQVNQATSGNIMSKSHSR